MARVNENEEIQTERGSKSYGVHVPVSGVSRMRVKPEHAVAEQS